MPDCRWCSLEMKQDALDKGLANIRRNYRARSSKGTLTEAALDQAHGADHADPRLRHCSSDVDLVIEAVFESMDVKKQVFEKLDAVVQQGAILASNTSALESR